MGDRRWLQIGFSVLVSVGALAYILSLGDFEEYLQLFADADLLQLLPLVLIVPLTQCLRAYRINALLSDRPGFLDPALYRVSSLHMFASSVLPARAGELALPLLLRTRYDVPINRGVGMLLVIRAYDLMGLLLVSSTALVLNESIGVIGTGMMPLAFLVFATAAAAAVVLPHVAKFGLRVVGGQTIMRGRIRTALEELLDASAILLSPFRWRRLVIATLLIWVAMNISFFLSMTSVTPSGTLIVAVVAGAAASLAVAQPVNGVAGLGVVHGAWAWAAHELGLSWSDAIASGIMVHAVQVIAVSINAALAAVLIRPKPFGTVSSQ